MRVNNISYRGIWVKKTNPKVIQIIDQRFLPHKWVIEDLKTLEAAARAIQEMHVRGAPLVGATGAFGMYLASLEISSQNSFDERMNQAARKLKKTRPTAINLDMGVDRVLAAIQKVSSRQEKISMALKTACEVAEGEIQICERIGEHGLKIIESIARKKKGETVHIQTHCNAGWLACVDWGTATAPIYKAFDKGVNLHVWVDETRPRNQGSSLTAWELAQHKVPHTLIVDSAAAHVMRQGITDLVLVGTDRTTSCGDVANKIGTYPLALVAQAHGVPFYVALPSTSIDWSLDDGALIPIEERSSEEITHIQGLDHDRIRKVLLTPQNTRVVNYAFDVTPAKLITGLITERGISQASRKGLLKLFPEKRKLLHG